MNCSVKYSSTLAVPLPEIAAPKINLDTSTLIDPETLEDSYVYVHCHFKNRWLNMLMRIWKTTFLIDQHSPSRSKLIHIENISYAPSWTLIPDRADYTFLLIFSSLPKSCTQFNLLEEITQPGGFFVKDIVRTESDVYHIEIQ
jgi:hypothetical protein